MHTIPMVITRKQGTERSCDIFSLLMEERIVSLCGEVTDDMAEVIIAELLYLDSIDHAPITIYINSPGGSVSAGLAIYDTMQYLHSPVSTICMGIAASMGAFLLAAGEKGKRFVLPNAEVMIHQPLGGAKGQATDVLIHAEHLRRTKERLNKILSENTGKNITQVAADTDRDNWLTAEEAVAYGLADIVLTKTKTTPAAADITSGQKTSGTAGSEEKGPETN